jgi:hypothetical protein
MADTRRPRARYTTGSAGGDRKVRAISFGAMFLEEENAGFHCSPGVARPRAPGSRPFCRVVCVPAMSQRTALKGARTLRGRNSTSSSRTPIRSVGGPSVSSCKVEPIGKGAGLSRDAGTAAGDAVRARHPPARPSPRDEAGAGGESRRARPEMSSEQTWPARHAGAGYGSARRGGPLDASEASPWGEERRG